MHDIDMVGILYFPRQFRFVHEALEDFMESEGFPFDKMFFKKNFLFVIVHCRSDYFAPVRFGDKLRIEVTVEHIGTTSFTLHYKIFREGETDKVGEAKTVHVCLDYKTRKKRPIPDDLRAVLKKHL